ncbi:acyltransferase family protein [Sphingomonas faeni]|uniref:acyltransferase family protein n=1 Tax=Sphingomonas faeni TaxID=185950 RepID=UPI003361D7C9
MTGAHAPQPGDRRALIGIQYLRAVAALMVVVFHLEPQLKRMGYAGFWPKGLSSGVDIFFVISGLIMWVTTSGRPVGVVDFWRRRVTRIAPLYWAFTLLMVALMLVAPKLLQTSRFDGWHVLTSFLFLPAAHPVLKTMEPVVMPGWTLNYEMFFYLIFGLWLLAPERLRLAGNVATIGLLVAIGAMIDLSPRTSVAGFYTSSIMIEFVLGIVLGVLVTRGAILAKVPAPLAWALLVGGLAFAVLLPTTSAGIPRAVTRGIPAFLAVGAMLVLELRGRIGDCRWLRWLGDASFSLYLSHFVVLSFVSQLWRRLSIAPSPTSYIAFGIFAVAISIVSGIVCYRFVEQPLTALFHPTRWHGARIGRWRRRTDRTA